MTLSTKRQKEIAKALTLLIPGAPYIDADVIRQTAAKRQYKALPRLHLRLAGCGLAHQARSY